MYRDEESIRVDVRCKYDWYLSQIFPTIFKERLNLELM
jgi:hypothetical protein